MAMAGEPQLAQTNPQAYYMWLVRSQRMPAAQAYDLVQQRFGQAKTPEQQQRDAANAQQNNSLAQVGGMVAGTAATTYGASLLGGGSAAAGAGAAGAGAAGAGAAGAGAAGAGAAGAGAGAATGGAVVGGAAAGAGGAAAAGSAGAAGASGAAGSSAAGASSGAAGAAGTAGIAAAIIIGLQNLWETGGKDIIKGRGDRSDWLNMAMPNLLPRLLGRKSIGKALTSGKSYAQNERDDFRGLLKQVAVADKDYNVTLADGSKFNIGLDGKTKYKNVGKNVDGKTERNVWDVDYSNPLSNYAVGQIDPLVRSIYKDEKNLKLEQYTGMLVNAATSNAKNEDEVLANINSMLGNSKLAELAGVQVPGAQPAPVQRPGQGQVARVSPGMYMNDQGRVSRASSVRQSLEQNYSKPSNKGKKR